jgi:tetratricopeptide (TPR) repeat protein
MTTDRITQLQKFYDEEPDDPFNLYALALEYLKLDPATSRTHFETLLRSHPDYLPTYYHAARLYSEMGDRQKAITVFEEGISLAKRIDDRKAQRELQSAYDEMMFE